MFLFFLIIGPEPHKPKIIPGKVALCPNCGGYSVDISKCTGCKRIIKEGAKILPDPDYKPGPDEKKLSPDLRNIRIAPKAGRRKTVGNEEPECIALSSDEEGDEEDEGTKGENGNKENPDGENNPGDADSGAAGNKDGENF